MERQIANAVDAGDGDYRVRLLRQRMAAEPENLSVRIELIEHYTRAGYPELALEHCRLAAARFPESAEIQLSLAKLLRKINMYLVDIHSQDGLLAYCTVRGYSIGTKPRTHFLIPQRKTDKQKHCNTHAKHNRVQLPFVLSPLTTWFPSSALCFRLLDPSIISLKAFTSVIILYRSHEVK